MNKQKDLYKLYKYILYKNINNYLYFKLEAPFRIDTIPSNVTYLAFGRGFNKPLKKGVIPNSVTHISFGDDFDQPLEAGIIPNSVTYLNFGARFNQLLKKDDIPNSVTYIFFLNSFNQPLTVGVIPNSVTHLYFTGEFNQPLEEGVIPNSVTYIFLPLGTRNNLKYIKNILYGIKNSIPKSVAHLDFQWKFNEPLEVGVIPNSVTHLSFGEDFNQFLKKDDIPNSVTHLTFGKYFNQPLTVGVIPNSVTHLTFGEYFNQPLTLGIIPNNIIEIILHKKYFNQNSINNNDIIIGCIFDRHFGFKKIVFENKYEISLSEKESIDKYLEFHLTKDKLIGNIILKELTEKVFHPDRLLKICMEYNIDLEELFEKYYNF